MNIFHKGSLRRLVESISGTCTRVGPPVILIAGTAVHPASVNFLRTQGIILAYSKHIVINMGAEIPGHAPAAACPEDNCSGSVTPVHAQDVRTDCPPRDTVRSH